MKLKRVQRWIHLLDGLVAEAVAVGGGDAAKMARSLFHGSPAPIQPSEKRPEITQFYRYAASLPRHDDAIALLTRWIGPDKPVGDLPPDAQPESWWYGQLVRLHVITSRAILANDSAGFAQARDLAEFVHAEIQPDHATGLPWAIHAFVLAGDECETTAEWVLNACMIQAGGTPDGAALVLLAETLYGLRHVAATHD